MSPLQAALRRQALVMVMAFPHHPVQEKAASDARTEWPRELCQIKTRNAVAESENIVAETAEKIFADLADAQTINRDKNAAWKVPLWQALTESGLPLAETMLAGWLLAQAKISSPDGEMTVAPASPKDRITVNADGSLSGKARGVPFATAAKHIAVLAGDAKGLSIALADASKCRIEAGIGLGGDHSDTVTFDKVQPVTVMPAP